MEKNHKNMLIYCHNSKYKTHYFIDIFNKLINKYKISNVSTLDITTDGFDDKWIKSNKNKWTIIFLPNCTGNWLSQDIKFYNETLEKRTQSMITLINKLKTMVEPGGVLIMSRWVDEVMKNILKIDKTLFSYPIIFRGVYIQGVIYYKENYVKSLYTDEETANKICNILKETYNTNFLKEYPKINNIFFNVKDFYAKNPNKFPNANKTLMSLLYNLENPKNKPNVDYITGPGNITKLISFITSKYDKIIYIFGENDHSNETGCIKANGINKINLNGKKHIGIEKYLLDLFKYSPVFIDFYVEFGIMLDRLETISTTSGQTLWDMLAQMKGCFGPLIDRDCPYNVRMHGTDARSILSNKYKSSVLADMQLKLSMNEIFKKRRNKMYIELYDFKEIYKDQIELLSKVKNNSDLIKIIKTDIENNTVIIKELKRSIIPKETIINFFIDNELDKSLAKIGYAADKIGKWFNLIKTQNDFPNKSGMITYILTVINAVTMDVYAAARMFKIFKVKETEYYPKEPHNIIYYAGTGHTEPMIRFLIYIGFNIIEKSNKDEILSCVSMEGIKQPLFT